MSDERKRIRRLTVAKRATNPKPRAGNRRAVRIASGADEANADADRGKAPSRRRVAPWVFLVALIPVLLIFAVGAYTINIVRHAQRAIATIAQPTLPRGPQVAVVTATPQPTNTPNPQGTIAPLPTVTIAPTATVDPIAAIHFDRKDPFTIMLLGVDTREGDTDSRSDTIILVSIDPLNQDDSIHMLSVPRDLLVMIAGGFGQGKMADVYSTGEVNHYLESPQHPGQGGPALVRDTLEQNFRIQIDYYAQVDFNGFKKIVDAVGGVSVDNPYPFDDDQYPTEDYQYTRAFFPEGLMHLYGEEALQFARSRYADDDYARNARQQQVLLGIRQQALQLNLLTKATDLIDALGSTVKTDFPTDQWLPFAKFGSQISGGAIRQFVLTDLLGTCANCNGFYSTIDWQQARQRAKEFSPKENKDYIAAQANGGVNKDATIVLENGTRTVGIASNWSTALHQQGYANSSFIDAPASTKGNVPQTSILYFASENEKTAQALATSLHLSAQRVDGKSARPAEAPTADILIVLGDDIAAPG